jgi:hypothetical protein
MEEWRDIRGFEGYYQVSNLGRVRSVDRIVRSRWGTEKPVAGHIIKCGLQPVGYLAMPMSKEGRAYRRSVHRLVAESFIPNPEGKPQVNHKNGIKTDNRVENLEWVTGVENCRHAIDEKLYEFPKGEERVQAKLTDQAVREIRALAAKGMWHKHIAARYGVGRKAITKVVNRQRWAHVE